MFNPILFIYKSITIFFLFFKKITNKLPNWCKTLIIWLLLIFISFILKKLFGLNLVEIFNNLILWKWLICFSVFINLISLIYYFSWIYISINYIINNITLPKNLPKFISNWMQIIFRISESEDKVLFLEIQFRHIIFYGILFLLSIFSLFLFL